jgi:hypothetical protein
MKWLFVALLWLLAASLALMVLWRMYRGKPVVLRGRWSPRLIRMVAIVLVVLGVGVGKSRPAPVEPADAKTAKNEEESLPPTLTPELVGTWLTVQAQGSHWSQFKSAFVQYQQAPGKADAQAVKSAESMARSLPAKFGALVLADLQAVSKDKAPPAPTLTALIAALDELEKLGYYDHWASGYLWRKASAADAGSKQLSELYARLYRHARVTDTLIRAQARVKPLLLSPRVWMSKGGPREPEKQQLAKYKESLAETLAAARLLYRTSDAGTWERDGVALFTVARGSAPFTLVRGGKRQALEEGQSFRFGRLDLIETAADKPVVLEHAWLERVTLPQGRLVSVWSLPECLSDEARGKVKQTVADALAGSEDAALRLERTLPLVHSLMRDGLTNPPAAKGAPTLRLILSLFDEAVMPAQPGPPTPGFPE